ncbi:uncharacterized protein LOC110931426 [Helianthus annuus]|uniref:uncharacterized protein LOC110931426 n=1 Tax=Helianthus annuus TaxID=4232 RepID=UPI000B8F6EE6|nr:uncharacterized protein LOC110931426 [Helianthus annuus]
MKKATAMGLFNGIKFSNEGLRVNLEKCSIYGIGVEDHEVQDMANLLRCKKAPIQVLESLDRIRRVFFWGGSEEKARMNWMAWDKTIAPVEYGGLGFGSLRDANIAMLAKWWWRFKTKKSGLWRRVIWAIHHNSRGWKDIPIKVSMARPWKSIASVRNILLAADIDLNTASNAVLADDKWLWKFDGSGSFNVASIKRILGAANRVRPARVFKWNNWVPEKVGIVAWRAEMERLPTKSALFARNIPVQNQMCAMCGNYFETSEHIFVSCHFAQLIWQNVVNWCSIPPIIAFDIKDLLTLHEISSGSSRKKKVL